MTDGWKSAERSQDIRAVMLRLSDLFSPTSGGQVIFRLFGPYEGVPNLLFTVIDISIPTTFFFLIKTNDLQDFAERLGDLGPVDYIQGLGQDFVRMMEQTTCGSGRIQNPVWMGVLTSLVAIFYYRI